MSSYSFFNFVGTKLFFMSDYWIGDTVKIIYSGKIGKFEGEINENAKVKTGNKILLVPLKDIEIVEEDEFDHFPPDDPVEKKLLDNKFRSFSDILDLHIDKLNPKIKNEPPQLIINHQIRIAKEYITEAIKRKRLSVTIIHGKGTGALKMEIHHLLKSFPQVYFTKNVNEEGAVEILFSYK